MKLRAVCVLLCLCTFIGCGGANEAPESPHAKQAKAQPTPAADAKAGQAPVKRPERDGAPIIRVLSPGSEPRALLRYTPAVSARETLLMVMRMKLAIGAPDRPGEPAELPGTSMHMNLVIDSVDQNGDISYRFDLASIDVEGNQQAPQLVEQIKSATSRLVGMGGRTKLNSRGVIQKMEMKIPSAVDPATKELLAEMERSMRQMCDPLPEEPVGTGARWDAHTRYSLRGLDIDQVRRYTLVKRDASKVSLKFIVEQTARPQSMRLPNLPPGAVVRLDQLASAGDGSVLLDTTKMVPQSSKMALKTTTVVSVRADAENMSVRTDMELDISIASAAAKK
jgi:hypothetical protein